MDKKIAFEETYKYLGDSDKLVERKNNEGFYEKWKYYSNGELAEHEFNVSKKENITIHRFNNKGMIEYAKNSDTGEVHEYKYDYFNEEKQLISSIWDNGKLIERNLLYNNEKILNEYKELNSGTIYCKYYDDKSRCIRYTEIGDNRKLILEYEYDDDTDIYRYLISRRIEDNKLVDHHIERYEHGNCFSNTYDCCTDKLIESTVYNSIGLPIADYDYKNGEIVCYEYNKDNNLTALYSNIHGKKHEWFYDNAGQCYYEIDRLNETEKIYIYDPILRPTGSIEQILVYSKSDYKNGEYIKEEWFEYDKKGRLKSSKISETEKPTIITFYEYDNLNRKIREYGYLEKE